MNTSEAKYYGEQLVGRPRAIKYATKLHSTLERVLGKSGNAFSGELSAFIVALAQMREDEMPQFEKGDLVRCCGETGEFVCYWNGKARVSFEGDDKKYRVVNIEEMRHV